MVATDRARRPSRRAGLEGLTSTASASRLRVPERPRRGTRSRASRGSPPLAPDGPGGVDPCPTYVTSAGGGPRGPHRPVVPPWPDRRRRPPGRAAEPSDPASLVPSLSTARGVASRAYPVRTVAGPPGKAAVRSAARPRPRGGFGGRREHAEDRHLDGRPDRPAGAPGPPGGGNRRHGGRPGRRRRRQRHRLLVLGP